MYGLFKFFDLMYFYCLEMGIKLEINEKMKNLYVFWGDKLIKFLVKEMDKNELIVNLVSIEYVKVILWKLLK